MAKSTPGLKRAAARKENRAFREKIAGMTNQQLRGFLNGFDTSTIDRIEKAILRIRDEQRDEEIKALSDQINALNARKKELETISK